MLRKLREMGAKCEDAGDCYICYYREGKEIFVISVAKGKVIYSKVAPFHKLPAVITCESIYLTPYGLYAFGESDEDLVNKVKEKLKRLSSLT